MISTLESALVESSPSDLPSPRSRLHDLLHERYAGDDRIPIRVAEDGEAIGTVQHVAEALHASHASVLRCAQKNRRVILIQREDGDDPVLILPDGVADLARCAHAR